MKVNNITKFLKERAQLLKKDIMAVYIALKHRQTPWFAKVMAALTVGYALSPIDLIPDFIPVVGYLDDIIILPAMIALTIKLIPKELFEKCRLESEKLFDNINLSKWYYAVPIIVFWILIIGLIVLWIV